MQSRPATTLSAAARLPNRPCQSSSTSKDTAAHRRAGGVPSFMKRGSSPRVSLRSSMTSTSGSSGAMSGRSVNEDRPSRSRNNSVVAKVDGAGIRIGAGLGDQAAGQQGSHHRVHVDAAHRAHPGARHRLAVGHHGQRLQRGAGQLRSAAPSSSSRSTYGAYRARVYMRQPPPASRRSIPLSRAASSSAITLQLGRHPVGRLLDRRGERVDGHRGVHHQQQRLEHRSRVRRPPAPAAWRPRCPGRGPGCRRVTRSPPLTVASRRSRSAVVATGSENSSVIVWLFHRLSGFDFVAGWPISGPRNLEHTKRF